MRKIPSLHRLAVSLALTFGLLTSGWIMLRAATAPPLPADLAAAIRATAPGQLVVGVAPDFDEGDLRAMLASSGATLDDWLPNLGLALASTPVGEELAVAEALNVEPTVDFIAPNRKLASVADVPLDPYWPQQWGLAKVSGPAAWDLAWGDPGVPIAIADTGILQNHWDLQGQTWYNPGESGVDPATGGRTCDVAIAHNGIDDDSNGYVDDCRGWDFVSDDANPQDEHGHGTVVAGIASAATDNPNPLPPGSYEGVAGMGRRASLMALRVLDSGGRGYAYDIAAAIDYAAVQGARVINLSLTFPPTTPDSPDIDILRRAIAAAQAGGVLVVGASGNENYNGVDYPAKLPGVLAVGASTRQDTRAYFSNYGVRLDLVAPGEGIISTLRAPGLHSYGYYGNTGSGTSFAAPHVAGTAALVRGLRPDLGQDAIYELIRRTADDVGAPGFDATTGWGRLNAYRAVSEAVAGLRLDLVAEHPTLTAGGQTAVRIEITAPSGVTAGGVTAGGVTAGIGARVALTASLGVMAPITVTADDRGRATAFFAAGPLTGVAHITATLGSVTATLPVTITSGQPARLDVQATPQIIPAGGRVVITATASDEGGSAVPDGAEVSFATTLGAVAPAKATTHGGSAGTILTAGALNGTAVVQASIGGLTATVPVAVVGAGAPFTLTLAADPAQLRIDGAPGRLTATVTDPLGHPVADGTVVAFTTDHGALSAPDAQTAGGVASVWLSPENALGAARVSARAGAAQDELVLPILAGPPVLMTLGVNPARVGTGGRVELAASVQDRYGNPVTDGTIVDFHSSGGQLTAASAPVSHGVALVRLVAPAAPGKLAVEALCGSVSAYASVEVLSSVYLPLVWR